VGVRLVCACAVSEVVVAWSVRVVRACAASDICGCGVQRVSSYASQCAFVGRH